MLTAAKFQSVAGESATFQIRKRKVLSNLWVGHRRIFHVGCQLVLQCIEMTFSSFKLMALLTFMAVSVSLYSVACVSDLVAFPFPLNT